MDKIVIPNADATVDVTLTRQELDWLTSGIVCGIRIGLIHPDDERPARLLLFRLSDLYNSLQIKKEE